MIICIILVSISTVQKTDFQWGDSTPETPRPCVRPFCHFRFSYAHIGENNTAESGGYEKKNKKKKKKLRNFIIRAEHAMGRCCAEQKRATAQLAADRKGASCRTGTTYTGKSLKVVVSFGPLADFYPDNGTGVGQVRPARTKPIETSLQWCVWKKKKKFRGVLRYTRAKY